MSKAPIILPGLIRIRQILAEVDPDPDRRRGFHPLLLESFASSLALGKPYSAEEFVVTVITIARDYAGNGIQDKGKWERQVNETVPNMPLRQIVEALIRGNSPETLAAARAQLKALGF